jgi:hypothetical protein
MAGKTLRQKKSGSKAAALQTQYYPTITVHEDSGLVKQKI